MARTAAPFLVECIDGRRMEYRGWRAYVYGAALTIALAPFFAVVYLVAALFVLAGVFTGRTTDA